MSDLKYLTLKLAKEYVFTTSPIGAIGGDVTLVLRRLVASLYASFVAFATLLYYAGLFIAKMLILAFPHASKLVDRIYRFHCTKLTKTDILIEFTILTLLLLFFIFRKRITAAWHRFESYISAKSKAAARAAPHVLFFASALFLAVVGRNFILPLTSATTMPLFTLVIPLVNTLRIIRSAPSSEEKPSEEHKNVLTLWVVLAIYHGLVTLLSTIPFSHRIVSVLPYMKELVIVILIWIQLSPVFTGIVFSSIISPIMARLSVHIPTAQNFEEKMRAGSSLTAMLKMLRIMNDGQVEFVNALLTDSLVTAMAILFLLTPYPIADVGMVMIAWLLPAFRTVALADTLTLRFTPRGRQSTSPEVDERILSAYHHWLHYWLWLAVLWLLRIYLFKPWPSIVILSTLWMQHAYFKGSRKVLPFLLKTFCLLKERHEAIDQERQLARARAQAEEQLEHEERARRIEDSGNQEMISPSPDLLAGQHSGSESLRELLPRADEEPIAEFLLTPDSELHRAIPEEPEPAHGYSDREDRSSPLSEDEYVRVDSEQPASTPVADMGAIAGGKENRSSEESVLSPNPRRRSRHK